MPTRAAMEGKGWKDGETGVLMKTSWVGAVRVRMARGPVNARGWTGKVQAERGS